MAGVQKLDFDSPDETRTPEKTRAELIRVGSTTANSQTATGGDPQRPLRSRSTTSQDAG